MLNSKNSGQIFFFGMIFIYIFQFAFMFILEFLGRDIDSSNVIFIYIINNTALLIAVFAFKGKDYKMLSSVKKTNWAALPWLILIFIGTLLTGLSLSTFFLYFLELLGYKSGGGIMLNMGTVPQLFIAIGVIAVLPSIFEEIFVRGAILDGLRKNGFVTAIFLSALFFMLMHGSAEQTVHQFLFGLIAGYIVIISGSLITGMIFHFINNLTTVLIIYFAGGIAAETEAELTFMDILSTYTILLAVGIVLLILGLKFYTEQLARARIKKDPSLTDGYIGIMRGRKDLKFIEKLCAWFADPVFVPEVSIGRKEVLDPWIYIAIGLGAALWITNFVYAFM